MICQNCGTQLSCGCKKRVASDGKQVCTQCLASYEQSIAQNKLKIDTLNSALTEAKQIIYND